VDAGDDRGLSQRQQIVVALLVSAVRVEALAVIFVRAQSVRLDHGAHGAIQDQDTFCEQTVEEIDAVFGHERQKNPTSLSAVGFLAPAL
jgi:hypothetical protein